MRSPSPAGPADVAIVDTLPSQDATLEAMTALPTDSLALSEGHVSVVAAPAEVFPELDMSSTAVADISAVVACPRSPVVGRSPLELSSFIDEVLAPVGPADLGEEVPPILMPGTPPHNGAEIESGDEDAEGSIVDEEDAV